MRCAGQRAPHPAGSAAHRHKGPPQLQAPGAPKVSKTAYLLDHLPGLPVLALPLSQGHSVQSNITVFTVLSPPPSLLAMIRYICFDNNGQHATRSTATFAYWQCQYTECLGNINATDWLDSNRLQALRQLWDQAQTVPRSKGPGGSTCQQLGPMIRIVCRCCCCAPLGRVRPVM